MFNLLSLDILRFELLNYLQDKDIIQLFKSNKFLSNQIPHIYLSEEWYTQIRSSERSFKIKKYKPVSIDEHEKFPSYITNLKANYNVVRLLQMYSPQCVLFSPPDTLTITIWGMSYINIRQIKKNVSLPFLKIYIYIK